MLLRSITKHVRDQNWFAVVLDFFIVVTGILIAFQITNWSEQRGDRSKENLYLSELVEDLNADLREVETVRRTAEIRMGVLEQVLAEVDIVPRRTLTYDGRSFTFDQAPPFESEDPYEANIQLTNDPTLDGSRETFQALISTGDLRLISNRHLARQLQSYYAFIIEANNLERSVLSQAVTINDSRRRLGVPLTGRVTIEDLGLLASTDAKFRAELETYWTGSAFQVRMMDRVRGRTEALLSAIKTEQEE